MIITSDAVPKNACGRGTGNNYITSHGLSTHATDSVRSHTCMIKFSIIECFQRLKWSGIIHPSSPVKNGINNHKGLLSHITRFSKPLIINIYGKLVTVFTRVLFLLFFLFFAAFRPCVDCSGHCSLVLLISTAVDVFLLVASSFAEKYSCRF